MNSEAVKGKPLSKDDTKALLGLIEHNRIIITKGTNASNNKFKTREWIRTATQFNATVASNCRRTPAQLRLKWENLKKNSRKRSAKIRMNNVDTGGGPPEYIAPDDILDRVASLLGNTVSGFTVPYRGDGENAGERIGHSSGDGGSDGDEGSFGEDARVNLEVVDMETDLTLTIDKDIDVTECDLVGHTKVTHSDSTPSRSKKLTFATPMFGKKKRADEARTARNIALAEYYVDKKKILNASFNNVKLQNEKLKLENEKLRLEIEMLKTSNNSMQ